MLRLQMKICDKEATMIRCELMGKDEEGMDEWRLAAGLQAAVWLASMD